MILGWSEALYYILELRVNWWACTASLPVLGDCTQPILTDNMSVMHYLNKYSIFQVHFAAISVCHSPVQLYSDASRVSCILTHLLEIWLLLGINFILLKFMEPLIVRYFTLDGCGFPDSYSAQRVNELQALKTRPPYVSFHRNKVVLRLHSKFHGKIVLQLCLNQSIKPTGDILETTVSAGREEATFCGYF